MSASPDRDIVRFCRRALGEVSEVEAACTPWYSATFRGAQTSVAFTVADDPCAFLADLPEAEVPICHGFLADIAAVSCVRRDDGWRIALEALTLGWGDDEGAGGASKPLPNPARVETTVRRTA